MVAWDWDTSVESGLFRREEGPRRGRCPSGFKLDPIDERLGLQESSLLAILQAFHPSEIPRRNPNRIMRQMAQKRP